MSKYNIKKSDGTTFLELNEKEVNTNYSLELVGYRDSVQKIDDEGITFHSAEVINSNFIKLLESSSSEIAPSNPITGQLWFKPSASILYIWSIDKWVQVNTGLLGNANQDLSNLTETGELKFSSLLNKINNNSSQIIQNNNQISENRSKLNNNISKTLENARNIQQNKDRIDNIDSRTVYKDRDALINGNITITKVNDYGSDWATRFRVLNTKMNGYQGSDKNAYSIGIDFCDNQWKYLGGMVSYINLDRNIQQITLKNHTISGKNDWLGIEYNINQNKSYLIASEDILKSLNYFTTPPGTILMCGSNNLPYRCLWCDGATVSRTTYADLFNVIGTTWGAGDGHSTFKLPDFRNRYPLGWGDIGLGVYTGEDLPNIKGFFWAIDRNYNGWNASSAINPTERQSAWMKGASSDNWMAGFSLNAHWSNNVYKDNSRIHPLSTVVNFCIKF